MGCYIWYSQEGPGRAAAPPSPLLAVSNVTAHPWTAIIINFTLSVTLTIVIRVKTAERIKLVSGIEASLPRLKLCYKGVRVPPE